MDIGRIAQIAKMVTMAANRQSDLKPHSAQTSLQIGLTSLITHHCRSGADRQPIGSLPSNISTIVGVVQQYSVCAFFFSDRDRIWKKFVMKQFLAPSFLPPCTTNVAEQVFTLQESGPREYHYRSLSCDIVWSFSRCWHSPMVRMPAHRTRREAENA